MDENSTEAEVEAEIRSKADEILYGMYMPFDMEALVFHCFCTGSHPVTNPNCLSANVH